MYTQYYRGARLRIFSGVRLLQVQLWKYAPLDISCALHERDHHEATSSCSSPACSAL